MTEAKTNQTTTEKQAKDKIINKMASMAIYMDLVTDPIGAVEKWRGALDPDKDIMLKDFADIAAGIETERTEDAKKIASYANEIYTNSVFQYKEAMQLLEGLQLKTEGIAQIIAPYYFVSNDLEPLAKTPLSEAEKKVITALAGQIDDIFTAVIDDLKDRSKQFSGVEKWPPDDCTAKDLYFSYLTIFANEYLNKQGPEPRIIWAQGGAQETITGEAHGETFDRLQMDAEFSELAAGEAAQPRQLELFPLLLPITPKYWVMPNNLFINDLEHGKKPRIIKGKNEYDLSVFGDKSDLTTYIAISYEPDENSGLTIKGPERLTAYERTVFNAIVSLWEARKEERPIITPEMIYKTMPGGGERIPPGQKGAIVKAIKKFQLMHIEIDATDEMHKRKVIGPKESFTLDSYCLLTTHVQRRVRNGQTVHAYRLEAEPIILTYSKAAKQLLTIHAKYLDIRQVKAGKITDKPIKMSEDRQAITNYLLQRIAAMKGDARNKTQKINHNILFETLFRDTGRENQDRYQEKDFRNFCFDVLDYQKAAGFISGYKKITEGRKIAGVEILL